MLPTDKTARKERPIARGVLDYFGDAIAEVAHVSFIGNKQHNPGEPMHWAKGKSTDHADCVARHLIERGRLDDDGLRHSAKAAWRALALLQIEIEADAIQPGQNGTTPDYEVEQARLIAAAQVPQDSAWQPEVDVKGLAVPGVVTDIRTVPTDHGFTLRGEMFETLFDLGCKEDVAKLIVDGTTFHDKRYMPDRFIYIAGPMRGIDKLNFPAFDAARDRFNEWGWHVISPADIDRAGGGDEAETPENIAKKTRDYFYRDMMALLFVASTEGGAIAMLPGYHKSTGGTAEFFDARWLKLLVLNAISGMTLLPPSPLEQSEMFYTVTKYLTE